MFQNLPSDDELRTLVKTSFSSILAGHDFKEIASEYSPEAMGNAALDYASDDLDIRFTRDRDHITVDVCGKRGLWVNLQELRDILNNSEPTMNLVDIRELGQYLERHYDDVVAALASDKRLELQRRIEKYRLVRGQKMYGDLLPPEYFKDYDKP